MYTSFDEIDKTKIESQILREYVAFKEQNPDSVILIQIGTFFETFFEDAEILSKVSNITLSSRSLKGIGQVMQAGIPVDSVEIHIKLLINNNYKVCLCPQYLDSNNNYYRKLVRKYTKGTIIENDFLDTNENNFILSLTKENDEFCLAYADVSTGQFYKTKSIDYSLILNEIHKISPSEILISKPNKELFKDIYIKYNVSLLDQGCFKTPQEAILNYCKDTQKEFSVKLNEIIEYKINDFLLMDEVTRINLELTRTKRLLKKKGSVFWFLNYTQTPMGARLLKKILNEPLLVEKLIEQRQNAVKELIADKSALEKAEKLMAYLCDLSRLGARISNSTILPKDLYTIVNNIKNVTSLKELMSKYSSPLLKINNKNYLKVLNLSTLIEQSIKEDATNEIMSGNIIKEGFDSSLDLLREQNTSVDKEIEKYALLEKRKLKIENLKISYSRLNGYFIEIPASYTANIPSDYLKKNSSTVVARYTTPYLKELETKKDDIIYKINQLEYELFSKIRREASVFVETIRFIATDIARIDVLISLAKAAILNNLACPKFGDKGIFVKNGYHPSLLKLKNELVKNDTELENGHLHILTGANMSGKSTYLKHNAIIVLLSQIGSFVPADSAEIKITDKLFLRQGSSDDLINNNSSFMVEMNDLKYILDNATKNSLILLDEPAKSTNSLEGGAIARAYLEYLVQNIGSKAIVVTHNFELTKIEKSYPFAINWQIGFSEENPTRKIQRGVVTSSNAIQTAKLAQLPDCIITKAQSYMQSLN